MRQHLAALLLLSTASIGLLWATALHAHEVRPAIADATITEDAINLQIELALEGLIAGLDLSAVQNTNESELSGMYDRMRALEPAALEQAFRGAWPGLGPGFRVEAGGQTVTLRIAEIRVPEVGDPELPRDSVLILTADLPPDGSPVAIGWRAAFGPLILRHANGGEDAFAGFLGPGAISPPLPRSGGDAEGAVQSFLRYLVVGVEHIVPKGLDHILFVLGLYFYSTRLAPLLWQVTAFTAAHTVTLAVATLGLINVPAEIVEPLIAASIVYVAIENLLPAHSTIWRTGVVFAFGLLHGIGFASVLGDVGLAQGQFVVSLIGFNIGIEIGQLLVIGAAWIGVGYWFSRKPYYPWISRVASVLIGCVGAWWVLERTVLA
ncbi:MAG: HupE/UreJ family protein [Pseudomonadota bacterium]